MNMLKAIFWEVAGLFVDDGLLALEILVVVGLAALSASVVPEAPLVAGAILWLGCLGMLWINVRSSSFR
jgi:hypothetical protein